MRRALVVRRAWWRRRKKRQRLGQRQGFAARAAGRRRRRSDLGGGGRCTPSATDRAAGFALKSGVAVYGGFARIETQLAQRNVTANVTTLSGDLAGNDGANFTNNSENSYSVITNSNIDSGSYPRRLHHFGRQCEQLERWACMGRRDVQPE